MRLISAHIRGTGRLVDTSIKLDQKVIAIVGPNEAGKSTLLKALAFMDGNAPLTPPERSRSTDIADDTPVVSLRYLLDKDDQAAVEDLNVEEAPTEVRISRRAAGGGPITDVLPAPRKSESELRTLSTDLEAVLKGAVLTPLARDDEGEEDPEEADGSVLLTDLGQLSKELNSYLSTNLSQREPIDALRHRADELIERLAHFTGTEEMEAPLARLGTWVDQDDPTDRVKEELWNRTPDVVLFSEADRTLASSYTLDENLTANTPAALGNLARLAGLDLDALVAAVQTSQISRRDTIKNVANKKLAEYFKIAWQQSSLKVELNIEGRLLRIGLVEDGVHASVFHERSAGLQMFVALNAFLASRETGRPTILLIDEAETHLHINAQADLVQMFAQQDKADKIIYTTHSPGCLPADLGVGIRAVVPEGEETSRVENNFWRLDGMAFSSLMFAMGASAAAFTPARCAVIAEGASDMILLPSLIRAATGLERLPYQVAPGLSEVPPDFYPDLDFEASKVAFVVDGDRGGDRLAKALGREVPAERIAKLGVPGIENVLDSDCYREAFAAVLHDHNATAMSVAPPVLPSSADGPWASVLEAWAAQEGWRVPSKREIASRLIEQDAIKLSPDGEVTLKTVHQALLRALGIKPPRLNDAPLVDEAWGTSA